MTLVPGAAGGKTDTDDDDDDAPPTTAVWPFLGQIERSIDWISLAYSYGTAVHPAAFHHRDFASSRVLERLNVG